MRKVLLLAGVFLSVLLTCAVEAQTSVNETSHNHLFDRAHDLFHKEKYAAAQSAFLQYAVVSDNEMMVSEARYYISICAAELLLSNTEQKTQDFRELHAESTRMPHSQFKLGEYYFRHKSYEKALAEFIEIDPFGLQPEEAEAYYFMAGYAQFVAGNLNEARAYFNEIIDYQNEYYHLSNYFHAYVSFENEEYELALKGFRRIHKHPKFKDFVPIYIAEVYAHNEDYDQVISYGDSILANKELQKRHVVELLMAQAYFKKKEYEKSKKLYEGYHDIRQLGKEDSYQYGYASYVIGDYKTAVKLFETFAIDEDSLGQNVSYHLADAYLQEEKKMEARNSFLFASRLGFDPLIQEESAFNYARLSHELKFEKAAMKAFDQFIRKYPKSPYTEEAKVNLTRILLASNNHLQAFAMIEKIPDPSKKIDEGYQRLAYNIGLEFLDIKNYEKGREYLNKSLLRGVVPEYRALAHFWIGESLFLQDRYEEALKAYKNYLFIPESKDLALTAIAHYNVAYCYLKTEETDNSNFKEALFHFENYLESDNGIYKKQFDSDAHLRIADCYFALGVYDKAITNYTTALTKNYGEQDYAMYQLGMIKGLQDKSVEKIEWLSKMVKKYQSSAYMDDALFELANERFILGNNQQALREFQYLNQDYPNNPYFKVALLKIGIIFYQLDRTEDAIAAFTEVIKEFPSTRESGEALGSIKNIYTDWGRAQEYFELIENLDIPDMRDSDKDSTLFQSALSSLKKNDCVKASQGLEAYLSKYPNGIFSIDAYFYLAECEHENNNFNGMLRALDAVIERRPNTFSNQAIEQAAAVCYERDSFARAIPYLELRTQIVNGNTELMAVYEALAKCHLELGSCSNAEKYLSKIEAFDDVEQDVLEKADYTLARCAMSSGDTAKAISLFSKVASTNENKLGAESQYLAAYLYYSKGDLDSAKATILRLKDRFAGQDYFLAKGFILLADVYGKKEDFFNAKAILSTIINNYEGEDLKIMAQEKLALYEAKEAAKTEQQEEEKSVQDTIEYNEK